MGYDTTFKGCFRVVPNFEPSHEAYLTQFGYTRRMKRNSFMAAELPDPERLAVGLPLGWEGGYFTGGQGFRGQNADPSIVDYNRAPEGQPGLWCRWEPGRDEQGRSTIQWDGAEKFYCYTAWLEYLVTHFLDPWSYTLNGEVEWQGEDKGDAGVIRVVNNKITKELR